MSVWVGVEVTILFAIFTNLTFSNLLSTTTSSRHTSTLSPPHCRLVCIHSPTLRLAKHQQKHTMDVEPLYCAEQIKVPEQLPAILKEWTKEVIRQNPRDINEFSAQYVSCLLRWLLRLLVVAACWYGSDCADFSVLCVCCCVPGHRWFQQKAKEAASGK